MLLRFLIVVIALMGGTFTSAQTAKASDINTPDVRCQNLQGDQFAKLEGAPAFIVKAIYTPASPGHVATCAVSGYVNPTINFGILLPVDTWNGRFVVRGCGGSCGSVALDLACAGHVRDGYACLHTDMGHSSTLVDNVWVDNNLQGLVDFGYRATHVTTVVGKAIIRAFYASDPQKSYFFACSTGGRQGLIEAQRFPQDFDGIVAIAPDGLWPFGAPTEATPTDIDKFNLDTAGKPILPNRKVLLIHRAVVRDCDMNDGVKDGLIGDPRQCRFDPAELQCKTKDIRNCLTEAQVSVVRKLYQWRGATKGSEFNWIGNFLRNAALPGEASKPVFDLGVGRGDPTVIQSLNLANNPDLRPFRDHGAKLILVQGWADYSVMPLPTVDYFETMTKTMDGPASTEKFARLFMIPGMDHCSGGEGAYAINYMAAISDWVEQGKAPAALRGIHPIAGAPLDYFSVDLPLLDPKYIAFERDHQAYPMPSIAVPGKADVTTVKDSRPLALQMADSLRLAEKGGLAAGYPQRSIVNLMMKSIWVVLYQSDASPDEQAAALATLPQTDLSPVGREVIERMRIELSLN